MELKKSWKHAWELGRKHSAIYANEMDAVRAMDLDEAELFAIFGTDEFYHAGFIGREPEWVEAIRFGELPDAGYSVNWAEHKREPGVSCVKIIRSPEDVHYNSIYNVTLANRDLIRVAGWWLGLSGSDGEPTLLGAIKVGDVNV